VDLRNVARAIGTLFLTPLRFSIQTGHARSSIFRRALSPRGEALPWITYPAIDLLSNVDLTGRRVLEFGAGQSTLWWLSRGAEVISFEDDAKWVQRIRHDAPIADIRLIEGDLRQFPAELRAERFDVVMIDGLRRQVAARIAREVMASSGCIIQDNSEGFWADEPGRYEIIELLAQFQRVDLYGFAPGLWRRHCTSIYFREYCFLFQNPRPPVRLDTTAEHDHTDST
jgi:hypothetical protein